MIYASNRCVAIPQREACAAARLSPLVPTVNDFGQTRPSLVMSLDYLVRFVQVHETFRQPELEALAFLANINLEFLFYSESVCLCSLLICRCR